MVKMDVIDRWVYGGCIGGIIICIIFLIVFNGGNFDENDGFTVKELADFACQEAHGTNALSYENGKLVCSKIKVIETEEFIHDLKGGA